jgi:hypothetical protein
VYFIVFLNTAIISLSKTLSTRTFVTHAVPRVTIREGHVKFRVVSILKVLAFIGQTGRTCHVTLYGRKGNLCPTQLQERAFKMKVTLAVSSYIGI